MWLLRRRHDEATPGPAPDGRRPAPADAEVQREWAQLPPLQRIDTGVDGVIDTGFDGDLISWRSPGVLRPLDHALSADGPSGMVLSSIARSALPARPAPSPTGTAVQRTITFEPPRRPTIAFAPDVPRVVEAVSFAGGEEEPVGGPLLEHEIPAEPAWSPAETSEPAGVVAPAPLPSPAVLPPAADEPDSVAPLLGPLITDPATPGPAPEEPAAPAAAGPARPAPAAPDSPARPIQRRATSSPRPLGLGAPLRAPTTGTAGATPADPPSAAPPTNSLAPMAASGPPAPIAPPPPTPPVVQRDSTEDGDDPAPGADPVAPSAEAPALDEAAPTEPDGQAEPATGSAPLLGDQPPLLPASAEPPQEPDAGLPPTVVQTRRVGLGAPLETVPAVPPTTGPPAPGAPPIVTDAVIDTEPDPAAAVTAEAGNDDTAAPSPPAPPAVTPSIAAPETAAGTAPLLSASAPALDAAPAAVSPAAGAAPPSTPIQRFASPSPAPAGGSSEPRAAAVPAVAPTLGAGRPPSPPPELGPGAAEPAHDTSASAAASSGIPVIGPAAAPAAVVALLGERPFAPAVTSLATPPDRREAPAAVQRAAGVPGLGPQTPGAEAPTPPTAAPAPFIGTAASARSPSRVVSWVDAGSVAVEAGVAQRQADGSVVFGMAASDLGEPAPDSGEDPVAQRAAATPAAPAGPAGGARSADGAELDELAKRLYGRLRVMLKHELRLDRERAGTLTQVRR